MADDEESKKRGSNDKLHLPTKDKIWVILAIAVLIAAFALVVIFGI